MAEISAEKCGLIEADLERAFTAECWRAADLTFKLWPQQEIIYHSIRSLPPHIDEAVVLCARQFGKSHLGVILAIEDCLRYDDVCILIIGPTLKQTREIVAPRLRRIAQDAPPGLIRPSKSEGKWYIGTSELVIGGMDVNSSAQRGKTVQTVYIEEIVESKEDDYLEALRSDIGPALTHSKGGKIIYLTTLPKIPDHPFITDTMARAELNGALYRYTIDDNRALSEEQYEACVRRSGGRHTDDFRREYLCEIIRDRQLVIVPDFDARLDVEAFTIPHWFNYQIFTDWGGVRDMTVSLLMGYDFLRAVDYVIDEMVWPANTPTENIVDDWKKWGVGIEWDKFLSKKPQAEQKQFIFKGVYPKKHVIDAPGQLQVDLRDTHRIAFDTPNKEDWESNVNHMANRFAIRKIKIHPRCRFTKQTCQSGIFNKKRTDFERTTALGHMDAAAALMYAIRDLDRSSPYPAQSQQSSNMFIAQPPKAPDVIPNKGFTRKEFKRFGKEE